MLWLSIHLPDLGLEIFKRRFPQVLCKPAVLVDDSKVCIVDQLAYDAGIKVGNSLATAHSLANGLMHFNRDESAECKRLRHLAAMAYRFTPLVSLSPPNALLMEVRGSLKLFGGLSRLVGRVSQLMSRLEHSASVGVGHTPFAALALAKANVHVPLPDLPGSSDLSRGSMRALARVSLAHSELEPRMVERLTNMGIFELGALLRLPQHELGKRSNTQLLSYLAKLTGKTPDPRLPEQPSERFHSSVHLLESISNKETLLFPMHRLASELMGWLKARQLGTTKVRWHFKPLSGETLAVEVKFARPRLAAKPMLDISKLTLENVELPEEVMSISLEALTIEPLARAGSEARDLFGALDASSANPSDLVDQITARLGDGSLQAIHSVDDHRPEYAWTPGAPSSLRASPNVAAPTAGTALDTDDLICDSLPFVAGRRPIWLFEPPQTVNPSHFEIMSGPERIEGGWWEQSMSRDYFVALHTNGACCWLYHDRNGWFLHGYFA